MDVARGARVRMEDKMFGRHYGAPPSLKQMCWIVIAVGLIGSAVIWLTFHT